MNSRPEAWLKQAHNDLALAELAKDNGFMAPGLLPRLSRRRKGTEGCPAGTWN